MGKGAWRPMQVGDLPLVSAIAAAVHPEYPESDAVFAERLRLFPAGCLVFNVGTGTAGYVLAHPWHRGCPPALDSLLGALPAGPGVMYLHDLALLPAARGAGAGRAAIRRIVELAGRLPMGLVAIGGTEAFWQGQGFRAAPAADKALGRYGPAAHYMERAAG